jgi:hypothetical protein
MAVGVAIAVPLMIVLTAPFSGLGIALGRVVVFVVSAAAIGLLERRHFGRVQTGFWLGNIARLILAGLAAAIVERILVAYLPSSWPTLVMATLAGCTIYAAVLLISRFADENDRRMVRKILERSA